jgi:hypothetical protein
VTERIPDRPFRFGLLLAALAVLFAGSVPLEYTQRLLSPRLALAAAELLLAFVLVAAVVNVSGHVRSVPARVARALVIAVILVQLLSVSLDSPQIGLISRALAILAIGFTIAVVLGFLIRATRVDTDTIYASICVYLLMSLSWGLWFSLLQVLEPKSFSFPESHPFRQDSLAAELYFSLVTLTTLGYGDVTPLTTAARMSAALEALVGQIYVVVMVARLVGLNVSQTLSKS